MNYILENTYDRKIFEIFNSAREIVIAGHVKPDGDCIGACMALAYGLAAIGKKATILLENYGAKYDCIPGRELIYQGDISNLTPDTFIACDCASKDRLGNASEVFDRAETTLSIDHHATNDSFAHYNILDSRMSSTCELVFNVIVSIMPITPEVGTALCAGILYDTGGLRHKSTTADTLALVGKLYTQNVPLSKIFNSLLFEHSITESKVLAKVIERTRLLDEYPLVTSYIRLADLDELGATSNDLDGIADYLIGTKGAEIALFAYERPDGSLKVSLRSVEIDVGSMVLKFKGGGHQRAAGFIFSGSYTDAVNKILELCAEA